MDNIVCKVEALGGTISTTDIPHMAEYKRLLRAKERGDLIKLRQGIYAVPEALLNTMIAARWRFTSTIWSTNNM